MALLGLLAFVASWVVPGIQAVRLGQLAQMFWYFEERGVALLFGTQG